MSDWTSIVPFGPGRYVSEVATTVGRAVTRTVGDHGGTIGSAIGCATDGVTSAVTTPWRSVTRHLTEEPAGATDDWGRDATLVRTIMLASRLRWDVSTGGDQHLPKRRGGLVVVNSLRWTSAPIFTAFAISEAIDRPVRFVGRPDDDLIGALARRLGGLLDHPDEVAGALRSEEIVVLGANASCSPHDIGAVDHTIVGAALSTAVRIFPAAATLHPLRRSARVEIGRALRPPKHRRGPLKELELSNDLCRAIGSLLTELDNTRTGTHLGEPSVLKIGDRR